MPGRGARYTVDVAVIGVGPGGPRQITLEAVDALGRLDAVVLLDKGESTASMRRLRTEMLERYAPDCDVLVVADPPRDRHPSDYATEVRRWHAARVDAIAEAIAALPEQPGRDRAAGAQRRVARPDGVGAARAGTVVQGREADRRRCRRRRGGSSGDLDAAAVPGFATRSPGAAAAAGRRYP